MARITSDLELLKRVLKMLPAGVPGDAIADVEADPYDGENGGGSYWVYVADGWFCGDMDCHTIHEDTLHELRSVCRSIRPADPAEPDEMSGYGPAWYNKRNRSGGRVFGALAEEYAAANAEPAPVEEPAAEPETAATEAENAAAALAESLEYNKGLCFESTGMALDLICERLEYVHGIPATWAGRSVYIDGQRAASIETSLENCDGGRVIGIYKYTLLLRR